VDLSNKLSKDKVDFEIKIIGGTLVYIARARLAHYAINEGFTHILWLDSDMTFSPNIVDDLLFCGKDMVCGAFVMRRPQWGPCVYTSINEDGSLEKVREFGIEPFRVAGCGMAAVLTKTELLKAVYDRFGTTFKPMDHLAEDVAFCWRVNEIGREIWCEPTVRPGHIAHIPVYAGEDLFGGLFQ
jgi:hypothetical protein